MAKMRFPMMRSKRAVLLTVAALMMSLLFFVIFSKDNIMPAYYESQPTNVRVHSLDSYAEIIPTMYEDALEVSTRDALYSLYLRKEQEGKLYENEKSFIEALESCITCGKEICSSGPACLSMNRTDLRSLGADLTTLANTTFNVDSSIVIHSVSIAQSYPYDVDVTADITYTIEDPLYQVKWTKRQDIHKVVSIVGLHDPLVGISTGGSMRKIIKRSNICEFNESCWDYSATKSFFNEQAFTYSIYAPSYLSRFVVDPKPSECCGIESFMNVSDGTNVSYLDHYYFTPYHSCSDEMILSYTSITPTFKLDYFTAGRYHMSDNGTQLCNP